MVMFQNRADAGRRLGARLRHLRGPDVVVVGLPRGGVPVALEVAEALDAPLDVILVRKVGVPFQPELGMGAIGEGGVRVVNPEVVRVADVSDVEWAEIETRERAELDRRAKRFRGDRPPMPMAGKTVVVVDDGIATGSTAKAACQVARQAGAARVVLAVPVAPPDWLTRLRGCADDLIALETPIPFFAVGQWYRDFTQTTDDEVVECLQRRASRTAPAPVGVVADCDDDPPLRDEDVSIPVHGLRLEGHLLIPEEPIGIVVFAHGSGSSRHSPRNRFVAEVLHRSRVGTLLFDLLTVDEEADRTNVFDVELLAARLAVVTKWVRAQPEVDGLPIGYFGASTGAAAALWAAAVPGSGIAAVVSRGGRPDMAADRLPAVTAPTLLIVGSLDEVVLALNHAALTRMQCESHLSYVAGATHLFEEPGTLARVADLAAEWFVAHMAAAADRTTTPA